MTEDSDDDRRGETRAPITLRVEYKRLNTFFADYTKNISRGGTFVRTGRPLAVGTEFTFVLSLPEHVEIELNGVVKWVIAEADARDDEPAGMGIQFVYADDAQRQAIHASVEGMMTEELGPLLTGKLLHGSGEAETEGGGAS